MRERPLLGGVMVCFGQNTMIAGTFPEFIEWFLMAPTGFTFRPESVMFPPDYPSASVWNM